STGLFAYRAATCNARGHQLIQNPRVNGRAVGRDLRRDRVHPQCRGEEPPRGRQVTPRWHEDIDDVPLLIDRPAEIRPPARDLQAGLIDEPPVTGSAAARPGSLDELRGEPLHPPVDSDVIDGGTA